MSSVNEGIDVWLRREISKYLKSTNTIKFITYENSKDIFCDKSHTKPTPNVVNLCHRLTATDTSRCNLCQMQVKLFPQISMVATMCPNLVIHNLIFSGDLLLAHYESTWSFNCWGDERGGQTLFGAFVVEFYKVAVIACI